LWRKLDVVALKKGITKLNFKGFMANSVQVNWNAIWIIYGPRDIVVKIVDNEQTCFFHWTQSLERHTKQLIAPSSKTCTMPSARNIRSQQPWRMPTFGMLHFDLGGTLSKLPTRAQLVELSALPCQWGGFMLHLFTLLCEFIVWLISKSCALISFN
jgi:hypothetical protein